MPFSAFDPANAVAAPAVTFAAPKTNQGWNLERFKSELDMRLGIRTDVVETDLAQWINDAYVDLATSIDIPELRASYAFDLEADKYLYLLPSSVRASIGMEVVDTAGYPIAGGYPLQKFSLDWFRAQKLLSGDVQGYFIHNRMIVLYPTPSAVRTVGIEVLIRPDPMTDNEHSPIIPYEWHRGILYRAAEYGFSSLNQAMKADVAHNEYVNYVRMRENVYAAEDTGRIPIGSVPRSRRRLQFARFPLSERNPDVE